ncbi:hypothetical protein Tco_0376931, partial [Tanacetum coccineum]
DHLKAERMVQPNLNPNKGNFLVMMDDEKELGMIDDVSLMNDEHLVDDRTVVEP